MSETQERLYLLSCTKDKRDEPAVPRKLYDASQYFKKKLEYIHAKEENPSFGILSAKHGLLHPEEKEIKPYDLRLSELSKEKRKEWAKEVVEKMEEQNLTDKHVELLSGEDYYKDLIPLFEEKGIAYSIPAEKVKLFDLMDHYDKLINQIKMPDAPEGDFQIIDADRIEIDPDQPRDIDDENYKDEIKELARSIAENGLSSPIEVLKTGEFSYRIVTGELRYRALTEYIGEETIPVRVYEDLSETELMSKQLAENFARNDLNRRDKVEAAAELSNRLEEKLDNNSPGQKGVQKEVANRIGVSENTVSKWMVAGRNATQKELERLEDDKDEVSISKLYHKYKDGEKLPTENSGDEDEGSESSSQTDFEKIKNWSSPPEVELDSLSSSKTKTVRSNMEEEVLPVYQKLVRQSEMDSEEVKTVKEKLEGIEDELDAKV